MAEGVPVTATMMDDCCPHWLGCFHCPTCGEEAELPDDPDGEPGIYVRYDADTDTHYLQCPQGHRYWVRDKT
jgi:hypothetical protein